MIERGCNVAAVPHHARSRDKILQQGKTARHALRLPKVRRVFQFEMRRAGSYARTYDAYM